jgi:peptide/nickel transport system permease protein
MKPALLWTDALVFLLVVGLIAFVVMARRHEHLRAPWQKVAADPVAMAAAVVLTWFVGIALLDSLHFRPALPPGPDGTVQYAPEIKSVLDVLTGPLATEQEKSYSAPFATHLFSKETVTLADGRQAREFPRLQFGGAHLKDPDRGEGADVMLRAGYGVAAGALAWRLLWLALRRWLGKATTARTMRNTLLGLCLVTGVLAALAPYYHVFGTDKVGQDVLYATLKSIRTGVLIGALTTLVTLPIAIGFGISAGYFGGWVDDIVQYVYTTLNSIPDVLLIAAAMLIMQTQLETHSSWFATGADRADARLLILCFIMGMTAWTGLARLLRGETLKIKELDYVIAANAFGVSDVRIMLRHILPNVLHIVLISVTMNFSSLVLAEAVLTYVGVGVDPTMYSFGNMINVARLELARDPVVWWQLAAAFAFMFVLVLSANLLADSIQDALDPKSRRRA